jgi:hypothetical protein
MPLNIKDMKPQRGTMHCNLWENSNISLPLGLLYNIRVPLEPFDSGHSYRAQPCKTHLDIECILFKDSNGKQEKNWTRLTGRHFELSFNDKTADASVYLGTEHCQFDTGIVFSNLQGVTFDIEMQLRIDFNIDTVNLPDNGYVKFKTKVDFQGLLLYPPESLPTFKNAQDPMTILKNFIDTDVYESSLDDYNNSNLRWKQLKPKS